MKISVTWLAVFLASLTAVATGVPASQATNLTEEFHKTYPLAADGRVSLKNVNGKVEITGWDRNEVQVDAVKRGETKEALAEAEIVIDASADSVSIRTRYPEHHNNRRMARVEYTLKVPRQARLAAIDTVNGSLVVSGVSGDVKASTVNGPLTADKLAGDVRLHTVNGRVEAAFDRVDSSRSISLNTVNGSVVLALPYKTDAEIEASTVHGRIRSDFALPVERLQRRRMGGSVTGRVGKGGAHIKLNTVNGSVEIQSIADGRRVRST